MRHHERRHYKGRRMSGHADGSGGSADVLTREQVLGELVEITRLEHGHLVHYLRLHYALGGDRQPGDSRPEAVVDAADAAMDVAFGDMRHFRALNQILVDAGRDPVLDRVAQVTPASGPPVDLAPMTPIQFQHFPQRERAVGEAVDGRYERVRRALSSATPPLSGDELERVSFLLDSVVGNGGHAGIGAALATTLGDIPPAEYLLVTNVEPTDELDQRLLALSDGSYRSLTRILRAAFGSTEFGSGPTINGDAVPKMNELHEINGILGLRQVLPLFTDPHED